MNSETIPIAKIVTTAHSASNGLADCTPSDKNTTMNNVATVKQTIAIDKNK